MSSHPIDISTKTLLKIAVVVLAIWVAYLISEILMIIAFAVIISSAIDGLVARLQKFNIPRILGVIFVYLSFILILAGISYSIVPVFLRELGILVDNFPSYYAQIADYFGLAGNLEAQVILPENLQKFLTGSDGGAIGSGGSIFLFFKNVFNGMTAIVVVFVLSFYLSLQEDGVKKFLQFITPKKYESYIAELWHRTHKKLGKWLQGQLLLGAIVGILVFVGLSIIGVPYALVLALIAAIFELVPVAGPIIASIPAIIFGFLVSPLIGLFTIIFYIIIQQMENHIIVPVVMKKAVGLSPVIVIVSLLIGVKLGGIWGMLLAVPVAAVIVELLSDMGEQNKDILI